MLVFPQIRPDFREDGCRIARWIPMERFAPYFAKTTVLPRLPPQEESDDSQGGLSPERVNETSEIGEGVCGWKGCGVNFLTVARLSAHIARMHSHAHRDGLFYCGWRDCARPHRGFNARYKMLVHVRTHTNERPHICNQCQKSFSRAENLKIHLRSHSKEKPYVCPYEGCGKAYSNSSDRFKHTRTHTVDKPYFCKVPGCSKKYTDPSSLRKHVKTYKHFTNERDLPRRESSDERQSSDNLSPTKENYVQSCISYSPPQIPTVPYGSSAYSDTLSSPLTYAPRRDRVIYVRPVEPVYPAKVPSQETSYMEYTQMYDYSYKNYYSCPNYSVLRPVNEKILKYEEQNNLREKVQVQANEDMPLNLICTKRINFECNALEDIVRHTDLPLDLSTKSYVSF